MVQNELQSVLEHASVPEHSAVFMEAMSGGRVFLEWPYMFIAAENWLLAIGYPPEGAYSTQAFDAALTQALRKTKAVDCWCICPELPERLKSHCCNRDRYLILPADITIPLRLDRLANRAATTLTVEESSQFTAAHRRLWAEFVGRKDLPPNVRELYARTESVLKRSSGLSLLNAWDSNGNLAASLFLNSAPHRFLSYIVGAHSRIHYTPYACDLLFREMILRAGESGKTYLHLGLEVNRGIRRFKTKWGATPGPLYEMAQWQESGAARESSRLLRPMLASFPRETMSKEQFMASLPKQRRFTMIWRLTKNGHTSWIGGTAHFFSYSFEYFFRTFFDNVDTVLFEGPLDNGSLNQVHEAGKQTDSQNPRIGDLLTQKEINDLDRVVCGPKGFLARLIGARSADPFDLRHHLSFTQPWMTFFSIWTAFLERHEWRQSVDLEAWNLAHEMGKIVGTLETIPEQIKTLESISADRVVSFLRECKGWKKHIRHWERTYLKGEIDDMFDTELEFPTLSDHVIQRRDSVFLERMLPYLEKGRCIVFVGTAHMIQLRQMLAKAGFTVRRGL